MSPTNDQVLAFSKLKPTPNTDQVSKFKLGTLSNGDKIKYGVIGFTVGAQVPAVPQGQSQSITHLSDVDKSRSGLITNGPGSVEVLAFINKSPRPTVDQIYRYKNSKLTKDEKTRFNVS